MGTLETNKWISPDTKKTPKTKEEIKNIYDWKKSETTQKAKEEGKILSWTISISAENDIKSPTKKWDIQHELYFGNTEELQTIIRESTSLKDFENKIITKYEGATIDTKLKFLAQFAATQAVHTANDNIVNGNVSDEKLFQALQEYSKTWEEMQAWDCKHIHSWTAEMAQKIWFPNSKTLSTTDYWNHEIALIDLWNWKITAVDYENYYTFDKKDIYKFHEQYIKSWKDINIIERIYDPKNWNVLGYLSTPLMDLVRNEQAWYKWVNQLLSDKTQWNLWTNINLKANNQGKYQIQIWYGKDKAYVYLDWAKIKENIYWNWEISYIATWVKLKNIEVIGWKIDAELRATKWDLNYTDWPMEGWITTFAWNAKHTAPLTEKLDLNSFISWAALIKKKMEEKGNSRWDIYDIWTWITYTNDILGINTKTSAWITGDLNIHEWWRNKNDISIKPWYYANTEIEIIENLKTWLWMTSNLEWRTIDWNISYKEWNIQWRIGASKTTYPDSIQLDSNEYYAEWNYKIEWANTKIWAKVEKNSKYNKETRWTVQVDTNF